MFYINYVLFYCVSAIVSLWYLRGVSTRALFEMRLCAISTRRMFVVL